jgi:hypothetical protein
MSDYEFETNYEKYHDDEGTSSQSTSEDLAEREQSEREVIAFEIMDAYDSIITLCPYSTDYKAILTKAYTANLVTFGELIYNNRNTQNYFPSFFFDKLHAEMIVNMKYIYVDLMRIGVNKYTLQSVHNAICESYEKYVKLKTQL